MSARRMATLLVCHAPRLRASTVALASALVLAATLALACGPAPKTAGDHHCADLVAKAVTTTSPVSGLWACLTDKLQQAIKAAGQTSDPDGAFSIGVALTETYVGGNSDFANYELVLNPQIAAQTGTKWVELIVWLDPTGSGKVDNVGVPQPAF